MDDVPPLIRAFELTPANRDVVDVSLRVIDAGGQHVTDLAVDTHYSYKLADRWKGPYVKEKDIIDPWDRPLRYDCPGIHNQDFDIYTLGADDQEGGEGENADIGNW